MTRLLSGGTKRFDGYELILIFLLRRFLDMAFGCILVNEFGILKIWVVRRRRLGPDRRLWIDADRIARELTTGRSGKRSLIGNRSSGIVVLNYCRAIPCVRYLSSMVRLSSCFIKLLDQ